MCEGNKTGSPSCIGGMKGKVGGEHIKIEGGAVFQMSVTFFLLFSMLCSMYYRIITI